MNSLTRYRRSLRGNKWIVLLALALMVALPAACQTTPAADTDSGDAVEITGTEGAAGADDTAGGVPTLDADAMRTQALQSLTAIVEQATKAVTTPEPGAEDGGAASQSPELGEPSDGAESSALEKVREQQATRDAAENIADVDHLVLSMPVMATFTPDPEGSDVSGHLVYLRNGGFWRIDAASEVREALDLDDDAMPRVFAPPNDPGRAWTSPDGTHMAFFAGPDAAMWISGTDGGYNHAVSEPLLPTDQYELAVVGGEAQSVRLRPGEDYTMVFLTESERPFSKLIDDNSYHIKGQARLRIVHAAAGESGRALVPFINGQPWGSN
ncbi:MAG: hypothetical protein ACK2T6_03515, partial [Anaerolineae bacterium]